MTDTTTTTPALPSQSFWNWLTGEMDAGWSFLANLWAQLIQSEVTALAPIAETALATLGIDFTQVTSLSQAAAVIGQVATATATAAEAAGLQAGASSLATTVGGAIANAVAALPAPSSTTPVTTATS